MDSKNMNRQLKEIGQRIRACREKAGISQEELATKVGYKSRSSINKIELGHTDIVQSKIEKIALAVNATPAYLMGWENEQGDVDIDLAAISIAKQLGVGPLDISAIIDEMDISSGFDTKTMKEISRRYFARYEKTPASVGERQITDDDLKLALFGGDGEVTDEMWEEAQFAVQFIKEKNKKKKESDGEIADRR